MIKKLLYKFKTYLFSEFLTTGNNQEVHQTILTNMYRQELGSNSRLPAFGDVGFSVHSQHDEDGILLYIFSLIGATTKKVVEICAGDGIECNAANLIINHRWTGLLVDGNANNITTARSFYENHSNSRYWPPKIIQEWITAENVNDILQAHDCQGEIDLLSLDIDGIDYWLWKSIGCISPRVVVLEFNHLWGPDESVSVPYDPNFKGEFSKYGSDYAGASLRAFVKLGKQKGYKLIGTNSISTNAFFLREDIESIFTEISPDQCFNHPRTQFGMKSRLPKVRDREWVRI